MRRPTAPVYVRGHIHHTQFGTFIRLPNPPDADDVRPVFPPPVSFVDEPTSSEESDEEPMPKRSRRSGERATTVGQFFSDLLGSDDEASPDDPGPSGTGNSLSAIIPTTGGPSTSAPASTTAVSAITVNDDDDLPDIGLRDASGQPVIATSSLVTRLASLSDAELAQGILSTQVGGPSSSGSVLSDAEILPLIGGDTQPVQGISQVIRDQTGVIDNTPEAIAAALDNNPPLTQLVNNAVPIQTTSNDLQTLALDDAVVNNILDSAPSLLDAVSGGSNANLGNLQPLALDSDQQQPLFTLGDDDNVDEDFIVQLQQQLQPQQQQQTTDTGLADAIADALQTTTDSGTTTETIDLGALLEAGLAGDADDEPNVLDIFFNTQVVPIIGLGLTAVAALNEPSLITYANDRVARLDASVFTDPDSEDSRKKLRETFAEIFQRYLVLRFRRGDAPEVVSGELYNITGFKGFYCSCHYTGS